MSLDLVQVDDLSTATLDDTDKVIIGESNTFKTATVSALRDAVIGSSAAVTTESDPYLSRATANAGIINKISLEKVVGGTVAYNQLMQNGDFAATTGWTKSNQWSFANSMATLSVTPSSATFYNLYQTLTTTADHKYLCACTVSGLSGTPTMNNFAWSTFWGNYPTQFKNLSADGRYIGIASATATTTYVGIKTQVNAIGTTFEENISNFMCVDLTQMFGSDIADYLYNLEDTTTGAGIAKLQEWGFFTDSYYAYNTGELKHVQATSHDTTGKNLMSPTAYTGSNIGYNLAVGKTVSLTEASANVSGNTISYTISAWGGLCFKTGNLPTGTYTVSVDARAVNSLRMSVWGVSTDNIIQSVTNSATAGVVTRTVTLQRGGYVLTWIGSNTAQTITISNLQAEIGSTATDYEAYVKHSYPLDSSLVLRGIPKLDADNNLYYDGDTYEPDGTVTRKYGIRAYTSGDATDGSTMVTDGTNTVYALTTETTESADPYQRIQSVAAGGTEAFTTTSIVPVGHETITADNILGALNMIAE